MQTIPSHLFLRLTLTLTGAFFLSLSDVAIAIPHITSVQGSIADGDTLFIQGSGFGSKAHAKPLFWWNADGGEHPSSLGREDWIPNTFNGTPSTQVVAPGSSQSYTWDFGSSMGNALGAVYFNSTKLYMYRKLYEDFDVTKDYGRSIHVNSIKGTFKIGELVTGGTSGATGVIQKIDTDSSGNAQTLFLSENGGTINDSPPVEFQTNETVTSSSGARGINDEPRGVFNTFNYKSFRLWPGDSSGNIGYPDHHTGFIGIQGAGDNGPNYDFDIDGNPNIWPLYPDGSYAKQIPYHWNNEEFFYQASSGIGVKDGIWDWRLNNTKFQNENPVITRPTATPGIYNVIFQGQVSNGAQLNSNIYYSSLYIDDTWQHVVLCQSSNWKTCKKVEIQIPVSWTTNNITINEHLGSINPKEYIYLYVFDKNGNVNQIGYNVCPKCPAPPVSLEIK